MARTKKDSSTGAPKLRPALTEEAAEQQNIGLAVDLARKKLMDGTASTPIIVFYLKLGTAQTELAAEKLRRENLLLEAKTKSIEAADRSDEMFNKAIEAMRRYSGNASEDDNDDEYPY